MKRKICVAAAAFLAAGLAGSEASAAPFSYGDVFAALNGGKVQHYNSSGVLLETLDTGLGGYTGGLAFDPSGNLYVANNSNNSITRFSSSAGHAASAFGTDLGLKKPEGLEFDNSGNLWVGSGCCGGAIKKIDGNGNVVSTLNTGRKSDWVRISNDETKVYYTEDVHNGIKAIDIATGQPTDPFSARYGFASFQVLPDGGVIAAHKGTIKKLDSLGKLVASFDVAGVDKWYAVDLDTDEGAFWAGSYLNDTLYKFDIASGSVLQTIDTGLGGENLFGLAVYRGGAQLSSVNSEVPEPATMGLLAVSAAAALFFRRRKA